MEKIAGRVCFTVVVLFSLVVVTEGFAEEMYKYIDKDGTPSYTDDIQLVPTEHRKKAVKIYNRPESPDKPSASQAAEPAGTESGEVSNPDGAIASFKKDPLKFLFSGRVLSVAAALAAFILALFAIGKVAARVGHQQAGMVIKIGLTFLGLLYVIGSYAGEMSEAFDALKEEVMDIKAKKEKHDAQVNKTADESVPAASR